MALLFFVVRRARFYSTYCMPGKQYEHMNIHTYVRPFICLQFFMKLPHLRPDPSLRSRMTPDGVGRKVAVSTNRHSERSEESHSPPRFLLAQKSDMFATRAWKKAFGVGRKTAVSTTVILSEAKNLTRHRGIDSAQILRYTRG